jgi:hypothetical protein
MWAGGLAMFPERFRAKASPGLIPGIDTGSRRERAPKQKAPVLFQSEPRL